MILYSIVECQPIHLGHLIVVLLAHQGTLICFGVIFTEPYITHMIRSLGLIELTRGMRVVGFIELLGMPALLSMAIVERSGTTYRLKRHGGRNAQDLGLSQDTQIESNLESESAIELKPKPKFSQSSHEARFGESRIEVGQKLQILEKGLRELVASQSRIESNVVEVLLYLHYSSSSVSTSSTMTTCMVSLLPPDPQNQDTSFHFYYFLVCIFVCTWTYFFVFYTSQLVKVLALLS